MSVVCIGFSLGLGLGMGLGGGGVGARYGLVHRGGGGEREGGG